MTLENASAMLERLDWRWKAIASGMAVAVLVHGAYAIAPSNELWSILLSLPARLLYPGAAALNMVGAIFHLSPEIVSPIVAVVAGVALNGLAFLAAVAAFRATRHRGNQGRIAFGLLAAAYVVGALTCS